MLLSLNHRQFEFLQWLILYAWRLLQFGNAMASTCFHLFFIPWVFWWLPSSFTLFPTPSFLETFKNTFLSTSRRETAPSQPCYRYTSEHSLAVLRFLPEVDNCEKLPLERAIASNDAAGVRFGVPAWLWAMTCKTASDCAGVSPPSRRPISASDIFDMLLLISWARRLGSIQSMGSRTPLYRWCRSRSIVLAGPHSEDGCIRVFIS